MPRLSAKNNCFGCTACSAVCPVKCIKMKPDENGFVYPVITDLSVCISCGACEKVCPVQHASRTCSWKPHAYAAYSRNDDLRMESSSGGIFSEIATEILKADGIVYGAAYDDKYRVFHDKVDCLEELHRLRGAKYSESWLGDTFSDLRSELKTGRKVLFAGTPCQTAGLKSFLGKEYENLLCIDFICHGVPSPMAWGQYVDYRAEKDAQGQHPEEINLRDKKTGWSRYLYSNYFRYPDGKEHRDISTQSLYMKLFTGNYILRLSCGNCLFKGYHRVSDITLGDFWGIWDIDPEMDDNKGTSVVLIQSEIGGYYWDLVKNRICYKRVELEQTSLQNPSMLNPSVRKKEREAVLDRIRSEGYKTMRVLSRDRRRNQVRKTLRILSNLLLRHH